MNHLGEIAARLPSLVLIGLVRIYQWTLSPFIGRQCRFTPSCSNYFIGAVQKYGAFRAPGGAFSASAAATRSTPAVTTLRDVQFGTGERHA